VTGAQDLLASTAEEAEAEQGDAAERGADETAIGPRRRRRRRRNGASSIHHLEALGVVEHADEALTPRGPHPAETAPSYPQLLPDHAGPVAPFSQADEAAGATARPGPAQPYPVYGPFQGEETWDIGAAYEQMRQPRSPFNAPEPSTPHGFGTQPHGIALPYQDRLSRSLRGDRATDVPPMSANQLGAVITQAIQQQTDRLLTQMRQTQAPPTMTIALPALPSTERVGVFVDVANLLYSSRNLRVSIDFGRLLEFLRGNRRLVRAHAYAPTSPEPHAEQQFLSVVKGVGYRITTKNYKTFSSGAKKADLDLDLCMDIVRMVDAKAVDSIVLVSGDSDFLPLLEYCSDHGVRVEVAAFEDAASMILRQSCDLFINLSLVDDIRA
jgi:uncharacterized LabA/DUF88 family protein